MTEDRKPNPKAPKEGKWPVEITDGSPDLSGVLLDATQNLIGSIPAAGSYESPYIHSGIGTTASLDICSPGITLSDYRFRNGEVKIPEELSELLIKKEYELALKWLEEYLSRVDTIAVTDSGKPWAYYADEIAICIFIENGFEKAAKFWNDLLEYFKEKASKLGKHIHRGHIYWNLGCLYFQHSFKDNKDYLTKLKISKDFLTKAMADNEALERKSAHAPESKFTSSFTRLGFAELITFLIDEEDPKVRTKWKKEEIPHKFYQLITQAHNLMIMTDDELEKAYVKDIQTKIKRILSAEAIKEYETMEIIEELDHIMEAQYFYKRSTLLLCGTLVESVKLGIEFDFKNRTGNKCSITDVFPDRILEFIYSVIKQFRDRVHAGLEKGFSYKVTRNMAKTLRILCYLLLDELAKRSHSTI